MKTNNTSHACKECGENATKLVRTSKDVRTLKGGLWLTDSHSEKNTHYCRSCWEFVLLFEELEEIKRIEVTP